MNSSLSLGLKNTSLNDTQKNVFKIPLCGLEWLYLASLVASFSRFLICLEGFHVFSQVQASCQLFQTKRLIIWWFSTTSKHEQIQIVGCTHVQSGNVMRTRAWNWPSRLLKVKLCSSKWCFLTCTEFKSPKGQPSGFSLNKWGNVI